MKIYIKGFAEKQNAIETALSNERTNKLIIHMLCIILAPHSSCVSHWIDEIHGFISDVDKLKTTKRYPSSKQIYKWSYGKKQDLVTDENWLIRKIRDVTKKEHITTDLTTLEIMGLLDDACIQYFTWLSLELSKYGTVANDDVHAEIQNILQQLCIL